MSSIPLSRVRTLLAAPIATGGRRRWWGCALGVTLALAACADDEGPGGCLEGTLSPPDSVVVTAAGEACLLPGTDSGWTFTWRLSAWPATGYAIRAFRIDSGIATPWEGSLLLLRRPLDGGVPMLVAGNWGTYGPHDDAKEILFAATQAEELVVEVLVPRAEDGGRIAVVIERCVVVPISPPDTLPVVELAAGCRSRSFVPGRVLNVTFIPFQAEAAATSFIHVTTVRTFGGDLHPAVAGPGLDLGCQVGGCLHHYYPAFNGTLGHSIVPPTAGRYTYLLGVDADSAGLASVAMIPEAPPVP